MELLNKDTDQNSRSQNLISQISILRSLSKEDLQKKWRELFSKEPPSYNRPFLLKRLIYRVQELAYGGLKPETRLKMDNLLADAGFNELAIKNKPGKGKRINTGLIPGTLLIREWQGKRHEVTVLADGFEYLGKRYRSLTAVATVISGTHWNGWVFFGVRRPGIKKGGDKE